MVRKTFALSAFCDFPWLKLAMNSIFVFERKVRSVHGLPPQKNRAPSIDRQGR